jgi:hypothetical protein
MRATRNLSPNNHAAEGVSGYSYAVPFGFDKWPTNFSTFLYTLTNAPTTNDSSSTAIFASQVSVPTMTWKTGHTKGHLKGIVYAGNATNSVEGATVTVTGPDSKTMSSDLTGFYGAVDLSPGTYTLIASNFNYLKVTNTVTVVGGAVTNSDFLLPAITIRTQPQDVNQLTGSNATFTVAADSVALLSYQWYFNATTPLAQKTNASLTLSNLTTADAGGYSVRLTNAVGAITSRVASLGVYTSAVPTLSSPAFVRAINQFRVGVTGVPGFNYAVQGSTNLQDWTWLGTNSAPFSFTNTSPLPYQFYRGVYLR